MTLFTTNKMLKQVQHDMRGVLTTSDRHCNIAIFIALALCFLIIPPALSAFQCVECPENFFCKNGQKTACPASTPVTNGTQKSLQSDCMTCYQKTGNSTTAGFKDGICTDCYTADPTKPAWNGSSCTTCLSAEGASKPVYSDLAGRCVSCGEKDSSTPNWNGTECVGCSNDKPYFNPSTLACEACPADKPNWDGTQCVTCEDGYYEEEITCADGTEWNEESGQCEEVIPEDAIEIPTDTESFYIIPGMVFSPPPVSKSTCETMASSSNYPEVTACSYDNDYWAGAVKVCRDAGKRLPTKEELAYLARVLYGNPTIAPETVVFQDINNQELFNTMIAGTRYEDSNDLYLWSAEQHTAEISSYRWFSYSGSSYYEDGDHSWRNDYNAFCVPQ